MISSVIFTAFEILIDVPEAIFAFWKEDDVNSNLALEFFSCSKRFSGIAFAQEQVSIKAFRQIFYQKEN